MEDEQLLRYSRQIMLPQVDIEGQEKLLAAHALIIGLGGLGSPAAMYLAAAGVGHLVLNDFDAVDLSNLQRQIIHDTGSLGIGKAESARRSLARINPEIRIDTIVHALEGRGLEEAVAAADVVLDCSDNFATRFAVNAACVATSTPLVSGAVIRFEGQLTVFTPGRDESPCYNCLYPDQGELAESCVRNGVIAPLPGIVGSMQALEAIKLLLGIGETLTGRLLLLDALSMEWRSMKLRRNPSCPTCGREISSGERGKIPL
ncbi:molybdopterin-synthase adenylyltransferase MoeB [Methylococcus sp. EFPC2]|uniref:HesA/MoeB/ThiF family protein n=1 Tax=Methylococcus sp. EFPC2 TaxID=2812648 RepID=UPI00196852E7|nr:molybdopterin-synthase adenylyltransferase MoeB [Methylococcus sp. EFPC2]QSA95867.1 molybdopterin-synthase adenylyltransferase MoeB [Methylococcus sp. EFPC2]